MVGLWMSVDVPGRIMGLRYYAAENDTPSRNLMVLAVQFEEGTVGATRSRFQTHVGVGGAWQHMYLHPPYHIDPGKIFNVRLGVLFGQWYQITGGLLAGAVTNGHITAIAPAAAPSTHNGNRGTAWTIPSVADGENLPALDVLFLADQ